MYETFISVLPIFFLIVTGLLAKRFFVESELFWRTNDKLVYYLFFPFLLIIKIGSANFDVGGVWIGIFITVAATAIIAVAIFLYRFLFSHDNPLFTSVFQGAVRYNSYIFIACSEALFGPRGGAVSGIFITIMIIFTNILSVVVMNRYGGGRKGIGAIVWKTATNPLIIGAIVGVFINVSGTRMGPEPISEFMRYLGHAATPLSLMSVGAGLSFIADRGKNFSILLAVFMKLLAMPAVAILLLKIYPAHDMLIASLAVLYCAVPCAGNAYILSRQMGGDSSAMASIITWETVISIMTIPVMMAMI